MTDPLPPTPPTGSLRQPDKRVRKRRRAEARFKAYGQIAIALALMALLTLAVSIGQKGASAFTRFEVAFDLPLEREAFAPALSADEDLTIANKVSILYDAVQADLQATFPEAADNTRLRRELTRLVIRLAVLPQAEKIAANPQMIGQRAQFTLPVSDDLDLFLKGGLSERRTVTVETPGRLSARMQGGYRFTDGGADGFPELNRLRQREDGEMRAFLVRIGPSWFEATDISGAAMALSHLSGPQPELGEQAGKPVSVLVLDEPETNRQVSNRLIVWTLSLQEQGRISRNFRLGLFNHSDSTHPELAGAASAIIGSLFTMLITALFAIPVGIFAAVYLEEFAPRGRMTSLIEVNINNLAAVPSIVFGLLGAAVFIQAFGMPRSVPFVGGLVLFLLVLPTVIIATRAALTSVPPSVRTAALGLGASKNQAVFHHVLPLAAPGIMTGAIIGMARALGETAPLLLIGMVAFVAEVPSGPNDEATVLPVLIYKWSTGAERAWEPMTSALIIILLGFLILMNLTAVLLRRYFERKW